MHLKDRKGLIRDTKRIFIHLRSSTTISGITYSRFNIAIPRCKHFKKWNGQENLFVIKKKGRYFAEFHPCLYFCKKWNEILQLQLYWH